MKKHDCSARYGHSTIHHYLLLMMCLLLQKCRSFLFHSCWRVFDFLSMTSYRTKRMILYDVWWWCLSFAMPSPFGRDLLLMSFLSLSFSIYCVTTENDFCSSLPWFPFCLSLVFMSLFHWSSTTRLSPYWISLVNLGKQTTCELSSLHLLKQA